SPSKWMEDSVGLEWLIDYFDAFTRDQTSKHSCLLILNSHIYSTPYEFRKDALDNNIHLALLPPHST
ncbi:hypothetical protein C7212DRAFT_81985, partial [Tuber magnatum]